MASFNPVSKAQEFYSDLWKAIIRPPRDEYIDEELGATKFKLQKDGQTFMRTDFEVLNEKGEKLMCSHYEPTDRRERELLPCVIYLHGNCSSRIEAHCALSTLLPLNITVVGFDFSGSGRSDGEYVTLGWNEEHDLKAVVDYLRENRRVSSLGLWGRSMGAVAALRYASKDALILAMVCDSPFSNLRQLAEELASSFVRIPIPKMLVGAALNMVRNTIKSKSGLDIDKLDVVQTARETNVPVMIVTGLDDIFVRSHHARALYENYKHNEKWYVEVEGDHNSQRSPRISNSIGIFFYQYLFCRFLFENFDESRTHAWAKLAANPETIFSNPYIGGDSQTPQQREYNEREFAPSSFAFVSGSSSPSISTLDVFASADSTVTSAVPARPVGATSPPTGPSRMHPPVRSGTQLPGALFEDPSKAP
eukprot:Gregarina_sp_Pseudo_9__849@NODE_1544_length_1508_cov_21_660313_g1431_i0_p1_GENE_NODE_1544_length_1508_cov_21_660313_g1431_i0NODE_1544_length_1508_cov_21_660313_g1431_i0_p1_ORF_typecomplete_len421_score43_33Hydrolase_4/PF12146_8/3_6e24Peptidase_S15/PF02129_18/5_2e20Peptidase_S15/PF02129_18/3e03Peptidase_S9/PF00326_21/2_8e14Abhydrolase_1/PF00561_20/1_2e12DUF818/PF05677_12/3_1e12DUF1100/PF06500_11/6_3e12Acyl_transf_2/PF02273_15/1_5e11DLH/PF01738_18/4_9e09Abhydrolase_6/PF12697_7/7_4e09FSH1/PF03959_1